LSLNWAYLIDQQKILYLSVNNVLGFQNVTGYEYSNTPDANAVFSRRALEHYSHRQTPSILSRFSGQLAKTAAIIN